MKKASLYLFFLLYISCVNENYESVIISTENYLFSVLSNKQSPAYLEINLLGEDSCSLDHVFSSIDLSQLETLVIINESIIFYKSYNLPNLKAIDLISKDIIEISFFDLPDSISILHLRAKHIEANRSFDRKIISQVILDIENPRLPSFTNDLGDVYYLTILGAVCDKFELSRFKKVEVLNDTPNCMKNSFDYSDSIKYKIMNDNN